MKQKATYFIVSLIFTILTLYFFGDKLEDSVRNTYRKNICNCDTLRPNEFLDSAGIPIIDFFSISGSHIGQQRNPVSVCFKADEYFNNNDTSGFNNCVKWIINNSITIDSCRLIQYNYDWLYGMKKPWRSAMAQGLSIKTLTQAYEASKDTSLLLYITEFINSFYLAVDSGGITYYINDSACWYEEYSHVSGENPMILNGMLYCLDGLYYNYEKTANKQSLNLFYKGINALEQELINYDNGYLSYYDNQKNIATDYYHNIHVRFLQKFYEITKNETLKKYYEKWKLYEPENYLKNKIENPNKAFVFILLNCVFFFYLVIRFISKILLKITKK